MATVMMFLTDGDRLDMTRHALAAAMLTQGARVDYALYLHDGLLTPGDPLLTHARDHGLILHCHSLGPATATDTAPLTIAAMGQMCRHYDRVVAMDSAMLAMQPVNVDSIGFDRYPIAAVYDFVDGTGVDNPELWHNCRTHRVSPHYFNTGMIVALGSRWDEGFLARYRHWQQIHAQACPYRTGCRSGDRCVWNLTFQNNWQRLPLDMNYQAGAMFTPGWTTAPMRHYGEQGFLPLRIRRSDTRDIALINAARQQVLGLPALGLPFNWPVRLADMARNHRRRDGVAEAMAALTGMMAQPFDGQRPGGTARA